MESIVGEKIRSIREGKNISREELAERSGLSIEKVSRIEDCEVLPALAPLIKIARVLGVRLGTFLDDQEQIGPAVCRNGQCSESIGFSNSETGTNKNMDYFAVAKSKSNRHMDPFVIKIVPSAEAAGLSTHEGEEFIYVLEGAVEVNYGKETYQLSQGDSIYYDSIVPHHVHAKDNAAKILAVVYTPI